MVDVWTTSDEPLVPSEATALSSSVVGGAIVNDAPTRGGEKVKSTESPCSGAVGQFGGSTSLGDTSNARFGASEMSAVPPDGRRDGTGHHGPRRVHEREGARVRDEDAPFGRDGVARRCAVARRARDERGQQRERASRRQERRFHRVVRCVERLAPRELERGPVPGRANPFVAQREAELNRTCDGGPRRAQDLGRAPREREKDPLAPGDDGRRQGERRRVEDDAARVTRTPVKPEIVESPEVNMYSSPLATT